jgi:hypothetical protein
MNIQYSCERNLRRYKNRQAKGERKTERTNKKTYGSLRDHHRVDTPGTKRKNGKRTKITFSEEMNGESKGEYPQKGSAPAFPARFPILWTRTHAVGLSALQNLKGVATSGNMRKRGEPGVEYVAGKKGLEGTDYPTMTSHRIPLA